MSTVATEVVILPLLPGTDIDTPSSNSYTIFRSVLDTLGQQPGFQRVFHGCQIENKNNLQMLIDWDSVPDHEAFIKSAAYGPFTRAINSICDGPVVGTHVHLKPHPPSGAVHSTPLLLSRLPQTVEWATFYLSPAISSSDATAFEETWWKLSAETVENADGFTGTAGGWIEEEVEKEGLDGKFKGYTVAIGWVNVEAHMAFRETEAFKTAMPKVRPFLKGSQAPHVMFQAP